MPARDGEAWSDEDVAKLREAFRVSLTLREAARFLERSPGSVKLRAATMKIVFRRG